MKFWIFVLVIISLGGGIIAEVFGPTPEEWQAYETRKNIEQARRDRAENLCVEKIKKGLARPHTFGYWKSDVYIDELGDGSYSVRIYGKVTDGFGNRIRHARKCNIKIGKDIQF